MMEQLSAHYVINVVLHAKILLQVVQIVWDPIEIL